ncbi:MAG: DEAD/DEAH box helicase family protein [Candidatus Gracilibacteria bacterium]|nr:DEAD/DEAH box helicase family protein [Candidatus Gracilibacteria bacterium]
MILKEYQKTAVKELLGASIKELNKSKEISSIVFKAPTGSGKTIMMQNFLQKFSESELKDEYCFLWISVNDLSRQSKLSFENNLEGSKLHFSHLSDVEDKELKNNEVLFINWESIRSVDKSTGEWKVLAMKDNERDENLPTYLEKTHESGRKVILIVDESHRSLDTPKAQELIKNFIKPVLQIEVSATPDSKDYEQKIEVDIDEVIKEGMIKKEVLVNESLADLADLDSETDKIILDLAFHKQRQLNNLYSNEGSDIKPLVLIQLPSEAKKTTDVDKTKLDRIIHILKEDYNLTFDNQRLAIWLSEDKTNKDLIDIENSPVEVLIFKQAIATGWDCPRAQILVMFREIKTVTFEIQTVGRILRMPEWKHYENETLNKAYVYTDLPKAEIGIGETAKNLIKNQIGIRNNDLYKHFSLQSFYKSRGDYKDIGFSFYNLLAETLVNRVSGEFNDFAKIDNLIKLEKNINTEEKEITSSILSDGKILVDIDDHTGEKIIAESEIETRTQEELIKLTFDNFARNEVGPQFTNIARSYTKIIEGLYYSLDYYFFGKFKTKLYYQKLILNNKDFFIEALKDAKDLYVDIRKQEVKSRKQEAEKTYTWSIPTSQGYTEKSKIINYNKNIIQPSFISFDSEKEQLFIEYFLEKSELVDFWYKNGTASEQFFAVPYTDEYGEKQSFYPDFIVYFKSGIIGLFDPKSGFTLKDGTLKAKGLEEYTKSNAKKGRKIIGGLIEVNKVPDTETVTMLINNIWNYSLENRKNFSVFNNSYIENYSFEEITGISESYKKDIQNEIEKLFHDLNNKKSSYVFFIDEQKNTGDFDFEKASELNNEISEIENKIKEKEKVLSELV